VRFYFTATEFLYDYNANLSKAVAAKRLRLTILCILLPLSSKNLPAQINLKSTHGKHVNAFAPVGVCIFKDRYFIYLI